MALKYSVLNGSTVISQDALFVDLDGTYLKTDLLHESLVHVLFTRPWVLFVAVFKLLNRGTTGLKQYLSKKYSPDFSSLPVHDEICQLIETSKLHGKKVILATASHARWAVKFAEHLGKFDNVLATEAKINNKGKYKLKAIKDYCSKNNIQSFAYVGDSLSDMAVWEGADYSIAVGKNRQIEKFLGANNKPFECLETKAPTLADYIQQLRIKQWAKNLLLFLPLILAHDILNIDKLIAISLACIAFGFCASSIYILNDLADLEADRKHPIKRFRPLASGSIPLTHGLGLMCTLCLCGLSIAWTLNPYYLAIALFYVLLNIAYSLHLKKIPIVDVYVLSSFYLIRIFAGAIVAMTPISSWLLAFSLFMFNSLAFGKRYSELVIQRMSLGDNLNKRGYSVSDIPLMELHGIASCYAATVIYGMYVQSEHIKKLYPNPAFLWIIIFVLQLTIYSYWLNARRGKVEDDPVAYFLANKSSYFFLAISIAALLLAKYFHSDFLDQLIHG